jgi:hypothetical protein
MKKTWVCVVSLALAIGLSAQDGGAERIMLSFSASGDSNATVLRDSLEAALAASPSCSSVLTYEAQEDDLLTAAAAKALCPIALYVDAKSSGTDVRVAWTYFFSAMENMELSSGSFTKASPGEDDLVSSFWTEVVEDLGAAIAALPSERIVVSGPPGVRVEGFGSPFTMPLQGSTEIEITLPAFVRWKAGSSAFLDANGNALIEDPRTRIDLAMRKIPAWTTEMALYDFSFPEARVSFLLGKRFFARLTFTEFFGGLNLQDYNGPPPEPSFFSGYSQMQAGCGFGAFFEGPESSLRFYSAVDFFFRLDTPNLSLYCDATAPFGISPLLGVEWGSTTRVKVYLELEGIYYPYAQVDTLLASRKSGNNNNPVFYGASWYAEFPLPSLGLRIYL